MTNNASNFIDSSYDMIYSVKKASDKTIDNSPPRGGRFIGRHQVKNDMHGSGEVGMSGRRRE